MFKIDVEIFSGLRLLIFYSRYQRQAKTLRPILPKPTAYVENEVDAEADADFDPYENGDEPDPSDDSDFDPSGGAKGKPKKAAAAKKKKSKRGGK